VCVEQFFLEGVELLVIQVELDLQGAIRHPSLLSEERQDVVKHVVKVYHRPSTWASADQFEHLHRIWQPLHRNRAQWGDLHHPLDQPQRLGGEANTAGSSELLHPGGQMRGLADGGVVHVQSLPMARNTTSPECKPTRICTSMPWGRRTSTQYRRMASCMRGLHSRPVPHGLRARWGRRRAP
jgi:hypothetical protein